MLKKILILILGLAFSLNGLTFFGDDEKGKQVKKDGEDKSQDQDSSTKKNDETQHQYDTLVYEDWENPDNKPSSNGADQIVNSGSENGGTGIGTSMKPSEVVSYVLDKRESRFEVNFKLYPNPAVSTLNISYDNAPQSIRVYSLTGVLMFESTDAQSVDVSAYAPGTYIVQLVYSDHVETGKFIKQI
jgi:hypothetical protein